MSALSRHILMSSFIPGSSLVAVAVLSVALVSGCDGPSESKPDPGNDSATTLPGTESLNAPTDDDGDGVSPNDGDCDDADAELYPGRAEECDGIDNNCNGVIDEGISDVDGDGTADCLDIEECDGRDNDGDGTVDEGFADDDHDGTPDCLGVEVCDGQDNDADGLVDEGFDADADGFTECGEDGSNADCDDNDATVFPNGTEVGSNERDDDCDGLVDEGAWAAGDLVITEIMNNPGEVVDPEGEWFEIFNASGRQVYLNGITIESDSRESHMVTSNDLLILAPGAFFVLGLNDDETTNGYALVGYPYAGVSLSNESDRLAVYAGSVLLDQVVWDDGATMPDADSASMGLDSGYYDATANDVASNWCVARIAWDPRSNDAGSPGSDNELCSTADHDGDGLTYDEGDCDDADPTVYPGAPEVDPTKDNDCDGAVEWGPTANAVVRGSGFTCDPIYLDGSGSADPDGGTLSYSWTLVSAPATSTRTSANIEDATTAFATLRPDVPGVYLFSLTVNDGGADSTPVTVTSTVSVRSTNSAPVADAGADQSVTGSGTCRSYSYGAYYECTACATQSFTLTSASTDPDGDDLSATWTVIAGSTYGTLSTSTGSSTTLSFANAPAYYGIATVTLVTVQLDVMDCMGATGTDTVDVSYSCTGS